MELPKNLSTTYLSFNEIKGKEELRFELFEWLKSKDLTVKQAEELLELTSREFRAACKSEMEKTKL